MVARSLAKTSPRTSTARARSLATRTSLRSSRSARTPASGLARVGNRRAMSAPPTAEAVPVTWTTSTTSATMETASPRKEVPWPIQSRTKRAFFRRESLAESIPPPRDETRHAPGDRGRSLAYPIALPDSSPHTKTDPVGENGVQLPRSPGLPADQLHGRGTLQVEDEDHQVVEPGQHDAQTRAARIPA